MAKFLNLDPELFGIDINDLSLRIVKLKKTSKGPIVVSFNEAKIPPGIVKEGVIKNQDALAHIIAKAAASVVGKSLATRCAIISLPEEKSFSRVIEMPTMNAEELASAVIFEAENYIPLPMNSVYLDFQTIASEKSGDKISVLVSSMAKSIVDAYVSCCKVAGLEPWVLEVESAAVTRALMQTGKYARPIGILDLGVSNTTFIIYAGNAIRFTASIPVGGQQLTSAIAAQLGIDFEKAESLKREFGLTRRGGEKYALEEILVLALATLVSQVKKYMDFYNSRISGQQQNDLEKISGLLLCGGGANLKRLPDFLAKELKIPVALGDPFANVFRKNISAKNNIPHEKALLFTTALGLALRGVQHNEPGI